MATVDIPSIPAGTWLVAIVGETGSGKSAWAMELALANRGEIIAADSRTVYRAMDIGTAKPSSADRAEVPHHLLDVVNPDESFNVANFKRLATAAILDIQNRGKLPFLVGGTGLYVDAVLYDFDFREPADPKQRAELERLSVEELQSRIKDAGWELPANKQNPRHLIRVLETGGAASVKKPLPPNTLVFGLSPDRDTLKKRLIKRTQQMINDGLVEETQQLAQKYGWKIEAMQTPAYTAIHQYLGKKISLDEAQRQIVQADLQLAKRQRTWFKRNSDIHWL